ncbi:MAG: 6-bladed beta-propeller [Balneolaceae bacterium]
MKRVILTLIFAAASFFGGYYFFYLSDQVVRDISGNFSKADYIGSFPSDNDPVYIGNVIKTVADYDYLYLLDQQQHSVLKYDYDGNFVSRIGTPGRGPGELVMPLGISLDESYLYTFEQDKMQIQKFSHGGEYRGVYLLFGAFEDVIVNGSDIWMVNHYFRGMPNFSDMPGMGDQAVFTIFNRSDSTFHSTGQYPEIYDQLNWQKGGVFVTEFENNIYTVFPRLPLVHVYNGITKELERIIPLRSEILDQQQDLLLDGQSPDIVFRGISINETGLFLPVFGDDMYIYHFDFEGNLTSVLDFGSFYDREDSDHYIRHLDTVYDPGTNTLRLFTHIFSWDNPRTVIVDVTL